jgi:hypothetical protein
MGLLKFTVRPPVRTFPVRDLRPLPLGKDERSPPCGANGGPAGRTAHRRGTSISRVPAPSRTGQDGAAQCRQSAALLPPAGEDGFTLEQPHGQVEHHRIHDGQDQSQGDDKATVQDDQASALPDKEQQQR